MNTLEIYENKLSGRNHCILNGTAIQSSTVYILMLIVECHSIAVLTVLTKM